MSETANALKAEREALAAKTSETLKFWQDTLKHLTTLSSGAIVILSAFADKSVVTNNKGIAGLIFALLILSLVIAVVGLIYLSLAHMRLAIEGKPQINLIKIVSWYEAAGAFCFIWALILLAILVVSRL